MKLVIDSNRVIASLLKDSTTRRILSNKSFEFVAPEFIKEEILKYKKEFIKKAKITSDEFEILLSLLFERIELIPKSEYEGHISKLKKDEISDKNDIPYIACYLSTKAEGIWSHDPHFQKQNKIKVFTNINLLNMYR